MTFPGDSALAKAEAKREQLAEDEQPIERDGTEDDCGGSCSLSSVFLIKHIRIQKVETF